MILFPILGLGAFLRLWRLPDRGLLYWDEGKFALEGLRVLSGIQGLLGSSAGLAAGKAVGTAKPTHALLIALSFAVLGVHDYSPLILDALCSIATIAVVYVLARRMFDEVSALLAALLLAVSGYDVIYARSALSESDANLLFLVGVLLWSCAWRRVAAGRWEVGAARWRPAAGFVFGMAFTTNYRLAVYVAVVVIADLAMLARERNRVSLLTAAGAWLGAVAIAPLAWEMIGLAVQATGQTLFQSEIGYHRTNYLAEAIYQLHQGRQSVFHFAPIAYVQWYVVRQGFLMTLFLVGALIVTAIRRSTSLLIPALLVVLPYAVYVFAPFDVPRNLDTTVPFTSMLVAATLTSEARRLVASANGRMATASIIATVLSLSCVSLSFHATAMRSGFAQAARFLAAHRDDGAIVTNEVMMFYLRDSTTACDAAPLPHRIAGLAMLNVPYKYAVVDNYNTAAKRYFLRRGRLVARYLVAGTTSLGENPVASENGVPPGAHERQHVDVYEMPALRSPASGPAPPHTCTLQRLA